MNTFLTLAYDVDFDTQSDIDLLNGWVDMVDGPDRAYLIFPSASDKGEEVAALWVLDDAYSNETLAAVLGIAEPSFTQDRPWFIRWIRNGRWFKRQEEIGIDRGVHLLLTLADYDVLDRKSHLFQPC